MTNFIKKIIGLTAAITALSFAAFSQGENLAGKHWTLTYLNGSVVANGKAFIEIDPAAGKFNGNAGCNRMFGSIKVTGRSIVISGVGTTKMMCAEAGAMNTEAQFTEALQRSSRYSVSGDSLTMYAGRRKLLGFGATAGQASDDSSKVKLRDKKWVLDAIGTTAAGELGKRAQIFFDPEKGTAGGDTSCNAFGANLTIDGNAIKIDQTMSTMRACIEDDRMNIERSFLAGLIEADRFEIRAGKLFLYKGEKLVLRFQGTDK